MDVTPVMSSASEPAAGPTGSLAAMAQQAWGALSYAARTVGVPAGVRGLAVELAYTAVHLSVYPLGLLDEALRPGGVHAHHRTDTLPPGERSLLVSDLDGSAIPVLLVHGIVDNRSIFHYLARTLRRRGHGTVQAVNYSPLTAFTGDIRTAARDLGDHVERLCAVSGADRVHIVGHSLGGLISRYYVQRLGGDARVDTLVTLGTPHRGSAIAHLLPPTLVPRQLQPGSDLLRELEEPAPDCRTRFLAVWSRMDQLIIPQRNARLEHPDLQVENVRLAHVGHMAMTIDPQVVHLVACRLGRTRPPRERIAAVTAAAG
ncbi:esterase/lipase family protein [Actinomycetospora soli]|uniref:esterase/lipase family protein n=1 Tax=Actinomycetospora soli TaxID=2893887 RepID=UPI001E2B1D97|nr:alpha/beta fold hydrolase [Actinomycetospora soli]MCD2189366.1 alpha/beta fold hydrolase [Actinomycetospora soli]